MKNIFSALLSILDDVLIYLKPSAGSGFVSFMFMTAANLVPLSGVIFLDWSPAVILIIYWAESVFTGILNVIKMLLSGFFAGGGFSPILMFSSIFLSVFFTIHYGLFMVVHGVFIVVLTYMTGDTTLINPDTLMNLIFQTGNPAVQETGIKPLLASFVFSEEGLAIAALAISSTASFYIHFIKSGEYLEVTPDRLMIKPYKRVIIMHLTIIFGAFALIMSGMDNRALVSVWVLLKILADLKGHARELRGDGA